jgi:hypothetical protein
VKVERGEPAGGTAVFVTPAAPSPIPVPYPVGVGAALATVAAAATDALEAAAGDVGLHFDDWTEETVTSTRDFADAGEQAGEALQQLAGGDLSALAGLIGGELSTSLGEVLAEYVTASAPELLGHLDRLGEVVGGGAGVVGLAVALAPPLEWARGVVETIGRLLEAMALGL